uniref:Uncharacterized protein n=1 Tax=Romanomermis culicivorax TaxID=13658 RepID=A0A915L3Q4_ROMCU
MDFVGLGASPSPLSWRPLERNIESCMARMISSEKRYFSDHPVDRGIRLLGHDIIMTKLTTVFSNRIEL